MRPQISWADLRGARVGVWGLGAEGRANLRTLRAMGSEAVIVDDRPEAVTDEVVLPTEGPGLEAMRACVAVVKAPGISRRRPEVAELEAAGVPVVGGLGLWLESVDHDRVLCITGTKGKSTTTSIAAHLARGLGRGQGRGVVRGGGRGPLGAGRDLRVVAGGNLGAPPWDPAGETTHDPDAVDLWVIETSSYQATDLASTPPVVAVTSLAPDHLPWHGDAEAYYRDKLSLCTQPGARLTVAAATSPLLVARRELLGPEVRWVGTDDTGAARAGAGGEADGGAGGRDWAEPLGLVGDHNRVNAEIARVCLEELGWPGADDEVALRAAAAGFAPLESRLEPAGVVGGVEFVDDSLSTNVLPTVAAVDAYPGRRIALIAGGFDRDLDYGPLAAALARRPDPTLVLTVYTTGPRIQQAVEAVAGPQLAARACADLDEAVRVGWAWAEPDGVVLLSPAAASFDAFADYRHKARAFRAAIDALPDAP